MTRQTAAPLEHRSLHASNRSAHEIARTMHANGWLDLNPPYQRGSVWSEDQRIALVKSWALGIPVPAVMFNDRTTSEWVKNEGREAVSSGKGVYGVIDGKQRVETAIAWFGGDLAVPASWFPAADVAETVETEDGPYVTFTGLTPIGQRYLSNRSMLPVIEARVESLREEAELYILVNAGGTAHTPDDLIRAEIMTVEEM